MARELRDALPAFRDRLSRLDDVARSQLGESVVARIYDATRRPGDVFDDLALSHPAIYMVQVALAQTLIDAGLRPRALLGSSLGELAACAVAGLVDPEDGLRLVIEQARIVEQLCPAGGMIAVLAEPAALDGTYGCEIAALNAPNHFVLSGTTASLEAVRVRLGELGLTYLDLPVRYGFHGGAIDRAGPAFLAASERVAFDRAKIPVFSCVRAGLVDEIDAAHLWSVVRREIRLMDALRVARSTLPDAQLVDVGPSGTLAALSKLNLDRASWPTVRPLLLPGASSAMSRIDALLSEHRGPRAAHELTSPAPAPARGRTMKAVLFPGQGSQKKGMGAELFAKYPDHVKRADGILGYSIVDLCTNDPERRLGQTQFTQPALYVTNALSYLSLVDEIGQPDLVAGHSLGEYDALFAASVFDFETGLRLVKKRGELMGLVFGGGMAAVVGLSRTEVERTLADAGLDEIDIANLNAPDQIVISGPRDAIERARGPFERAGAQLFVVLQVSGAFHSRYMAAARGEFEAFLAGFELRAPRIPVISNADATEYPDHDLHEVLARQLTDSVRFSESVQLLLRRGITEFREAGPGNVLTRLVDKIKKAPLPPEPMALPRSAPPKLGLVTLAASVAPPVAHEAHEDPVGSPDTWLDAPSIPPPARVPAVAESGIDLLAQSAEVPRALSPSSLGDSAFRRDHGVRTAYVAGGLDEGVTSVALVTAMSRAGMLAYFGATGLPLDELERSIAAMRSAVADGPWGVSMVHDPVQPEREDQLVELLLRSGVRSIEARGFVEVTPALVKLRARSTGQRGPRRLLARVSRPEVAEAFLSPPPERILARLVTEGAISEAEAAAARGLPMCDDVCVDTESGWLADFGSVEVLLPVVSALRDRAMATHRYARRVRVGVAAVGTPAAAASAILLGADFVVATAINHATIEAATSDASKDLLERIGVQDTDFAPCPDLFEMGGKVRVVKRGLMFAARANKLAEVYRQHDSLEAIDERTRTQLEERIFKKSLARVWQEASAALDPEARERAERHPRQKMALVFRTYLVACRRAAIAGDTERAVDYLVPSGPSLGAFNEWVRGGPLERWRDRGVVAIADAIMFGAAALLSARFTALFGGGAAEDGAYRAA